MDSQTTLEVRGDPYAVVCVYSLEARRISSLAFIEPNEESAGWALQVQVISEVGAEYDFSSAIAAINGWETYTSQTAGDDISHLPEESAVELRPDGLGHAQFGDSADQAIAYLLAALGEPTDVSGWSDTNGVATCSYSRFNVYEWWNLTVTLVEDPAGRQTFQGFETGTYVGYTLGQQEVDEPIIPYLTTRQGIGVGSSLDELLSIDPSATFDLYEPASYITSDNAFRGDLYAVDAGYVVGSIQAGWHGCGG